MSSSICLILFFISFYQFESLNLIVFGWIEFNLLTSSIIDHWYFSSSKYLWHPVDLSGSPVSTDVSKHIKCQVYNILTTCSTLHLSLSKLFLSRPIFPIPNRNIYIFDLKLCVASSKKKWKRWFQSPENSTSKTVCWKTRGIHAPKFWFLVTSS